MESERIKSGGLDRFGKKAEKVLGQKFTGIKKRSVNDYQKLINELEGYQVELRMQNEELRNAREELLKSQKRYFDIYDFASIGCLIIDQNGQILEANLTGAWMLGMERDCLIKSSFSRFVAGENRDMFYLHCKRIFETSLKHSCDLKLVKKDGTPFFAQLESIAFKDRDGKCRQFRTAFIDITEHKNVEDKLKEKTHDLIRKNKELNCLYNISAIVEKSGISLEEIIQKIVDIIPSFWQYPEIACSRIVLEGREWRTINFRETIWKQASDIIIHGDISGVLEVFYMEEKSEREEGPFLREERNLINIISERFGRIIEQKRNEKALQDSEAKFKALSENSPNMIFIQKNGNIVYVNKKCKEIIGYESEDFYSPDFDFFSLYSTEFRDIVKTNFERLIKGDEIPQCLYTIITTKAGKRIKTILSAKKIIYEGDKAILGIVTDITKLKEAEKVLKRDKETFEKFVREKTEELIRAQEKLQNAKRLSDIGILAATVAHELRNPLAVIQTASYNIRRKNRNPLLDKHLDNIKKCISESNQIINNLLFYSRIKNPKHEKINIYDILDECIVLQEERFYKENLFIHKDIKSLKDIYIDADRLQMKELFINILNNAYDALTENVVENISWDTGGNGGGNSINNGGRIEIVASCNGSNFIKMYFKDNGSGISNGDLNRVFEPFFSKKSKGTGLGLTVCNQIVCLHEGKIEIDSEKGKGTTITIRLPIKRGKDDRENSYN
ncbi:MAG: PAS domain S-box protein [bacterium]